MLYITESKRRWCFKKKGGIDSADTPSKMSTKDDYWIKQHEGHQ